MIEAPVLQFQYTSLTGRSGDVGVAPGFLQGTLHMNKKQHRLFMHIPPNISDLWQFHSHLRKSNVDCIAFNINLLFYPLSLHYTHQEEWFLDDEPLGETVHGLESNYLGSDLASATYYL